MSDSAQTGVRRPDLSSARLRRRYRAERRFRAYGLIAIGLAIGMLLLLLASITLQSASAFRETLVRLTVTYDEQLIDPAGDRDLSVLRDANYLALVKRAVAASFPEITSRSEKSQLYGIVTTDSWLSLRARVLEDPSVLGATEEVWVAASDDADTYFKGLVDVSLSEGDRRVSDLQVRAMDTLRERGDVEIRFNRTLFSRGDSREPELAGILGAIVGSALMLTVTLLLSFPVGILAAVYLEEFAPKNRLTDVIEVNINNLAAVPSIVYGLLGLAVFLNLMMLPRSAPLVGGMVLALMTLPTMIIAARAALKAVPPSIREAALGVGASDLQVVMHHVVPLAMPGILTGTIIGMARALGETAPLLMIGMVAFIVDIPTSFTDPATALPVQIFIWADSPERAFTARTAAAIAVLLGFLVAMNGLAQFFRYRFERRW